MCVLNTYTVHHYIVVNDVKGDIFKNQIGMNSNFLLNLFCKCFKIAKWMYRHWSKSPFYISQKSFKVNFYLYSKRGNFLSCLVSLELVLFNRKKNHCELEWFFFSYKAWLLSGHRVMIWKYIFFWTEYVSLSNKLSWRKSICIEISISKDGVIL